jgi:hypothetical protein
LENDLTINLQIIEWVIINLTPYTSVVMRIKETYWNNEYHQEKTVDCYTWLWKNFSKNHDWTKLCNILCTNNNCLKCVCDVLHLSECVTWLNGWMNTLYL